MPVSTVPIWIPSWDEHPEIVSVLDAYERVDIFMGGAAARTTEDVMQAPDERVIVNGIKMAFLRGTSHPFPVSRLINRLGAWLTDDATRLTIESEDIQHLRDYVARVTTRTTGPRISLSPEEQRFCQAHRLLPYLPVAEELIEACFQNPLVVSTELMKDPEAQGEWLLINVKVDADIDTVLDMCDAFTREWVVRVPWPQREKIVVDCSIIDNP